MKISLWKWLNTEKKWKTFAYTLLGIQAVFSLIAVIVIAKLNMLPAGYVFAIMFLFLLFLALADLMLIISKKRRKKNKESLKMMRSLGIVVSAIAIIISIFLISVLSKLINTIDSVTADDTVIIETTAVYVLTDDPAKEIEDTRDYVFGYTEAFDYENTQTAMENIENKLSSSINTSEYASVVEMVDALYAGQIGALILNEAYEDILADMEDYADFVLKTRIIYESKVEVVQEVEEETNIDVTKDPFIVYISGSDTRSSSLATSRSDVNILAVVNPTTKQVLLLNTPRDYYIDISVAAGSKDKLTHCGIYGIECSMDTLSSLYGYDVNYYAQVNFAGFETLVDAVGGIVVNNDKAFTSSPGASRDEVTTYSFAKGENYLGGKQALAFVRERHNLPDGDYARGRHQMAAIKALVNKLTSVTLLTNYSDIMDSMDGMFSTALSASEISSLVKMQLSDNSSWNIETFTVTGSNAKTTTYSMPTLKSFVIIPDETSVQYAKSLIQKVFDGETLTDEDMDMSSAQAESAQ